MSATKELRRQLHYRQNPIDWAVDYMGVDEATMRWSMHDEYDDHEWDGSVDPVVQLANSLADGNDRRVACTSGIGLSKTFSLGWLVLWFADVYRPSFVATIAPKEDQLKLNMWKEIDSRFWPKFKELHPQAKQMNLEIRMKPDKSREDDSGRSDWKIVGYVAGVGADETTAVKARGFHQEHMLIVFEEMTGVSEEVVKAFQDTATAPHNVIVGLGNSDDENDPLSKFARKNSTKHIRWSAYDFPNVVLDDPRYIVGGATKQSIEDLKEEVGGDESDSRFQSRVRGLIPTVSSRSLYKQAELNKAKEHLINEPRYHFDHEDENRGVEGFTEIYFKPDHDYLSKYILFMDVAGESDGDWHASVLWNRVERRPDAIVRMRGLGAAYIEACLSLADRFTIPSDDGTWAHPMMVWETNGVGAHFPRIDINHPKYDSLQDWPNVYFRRNEEAKGASPRKTWGWRTTGGQSGTRRKMIEELRTWARELRHYPERMVSPYIYEEAKHFIKKESRGRMKYMAASGHHDDLQMALGGAMVLDRSLHEPISYEKQKAQSQQDQYNERAQRAMAQARSGKQDDPFDVDISNF